MECRHFIITFSKRAFLSNKQDKMTLMYSKRWSLTRKPTLPEFSLLRISLKVILGHWTWSMISWLASLELPLWALTRWIPWKAKLQVNSIILLPLHVPLYSLSLYLFWVAWYFWLSGATIESIMLLTSFWTLTYLWKIRAK